MRLFTAIDLPEELVASLSKLLAGLKPTARINWSPPQNLHITTKFIGEWPEERLPELTTALHAVPRRPAIPIVIEKLGLFPNPHSPRVLWAGIQAGETLAQLARDTEDALAPLGIAKEQRPYSPHLTLTRIKTPGKQARGQTHERKQSLDERRRARRDDRPRLPDFPEVPRWESGGAKP